MDELLAILIITRNNYWVAAMQRYLPDTQEGISICNIPLVSLYAPAKAIY